MAQGFTKLMDWLRTYWAIITTLFSVLGICLYTLFSIYFSLTARADVDQLQNEQIKELKAEQVAQDKELAILKSELAYIKEDTKETLSILRGIQFKPL